MAYQIVDSDIPGKPYAVIDTGSRAVMGCHATREAASIQMSTLHVNGAEQPTPTPRRAAPTPPPEPELPARREEPPIAYSPSRTVMW